MSSLVESLLTLARLDENQQLDASKVDMIELVQSVIKSSSATDKKLSISVLTLSGAKLAKDEKIFAEINESQILQVLVNLI